MNKIKQIGKRLVKNAQAVSPIIATLMLVLVAVGSAGAFYVWQSGWQKDVQGKAGGADIKDSLTIGGSTTVYEFGATAAQYFEAANPNYKVNVQKGGSGAGKAAVGTGAIAIGMSSSALTSTDKATWPDLDQDGVKDIGKEMVETHVAYDAVVIIVPSGHSLQSIDERVLTAIYHRNGGDLAYALPGALSAGGDNIFQWTEIPVDSANTAPATWGAAPFCTEVGTIKIYDRSDISGTEETFSTKMIDTGKNTLEEAGLTANHVDSNQVMVTTVAADANGIGFAAYGVAKLATGVKVLKMVLDSDDINGNSIKGETTLDLVDPSAATFITYVKALKTECAKKLFFITVGEPSGEAKTFIDFCLAPEMNAQICTTGGYINKY